MLDVSSAGEVTCLTFGSLYKIPEVWQLFPLDPCSFLGKIFGIQGNMMALTADGNADVVFVRKLFLLLTRNL
jgi:hypothetical protein